MGQSSHFSTSQLAFACLFVVLAASTYKLFSVPRSLRHLPRVSISASLWSYLTVEVEDRRIERLLKPFAEKGDGVVLIWALGRWMVHILDQKIARQMLDDIVTYPKEHPPDDLLLWKFVGRSNILLQNGEGWKKHSRVIRGALNQSVPIGQFVHLSEKLCKKIGKGGLFNFDDLSQRFALDAVGSTALGYDFNAIEEESLFVEEYNGVMHGIANPAYLIVPFLERLFPRRKLKRRMDSLIERFQKLLLEKKTNPGDDMMTYLLKEPDMSDEELINNMVLLFIAGHDTSAGGISTLIYYFAKHPDVQERAYQEVLAALQGEKAHNLDVTHMQSMPFLNACIREALRINTPISYIVPRASTVDTTLGPYRIPAGTSLIVDMYAIHHCTANYANPHTFDPGRYMPGGKQSVVDDSWLPFALGPRQCPARNFALYEQRVLTVMLLLHFTWRLPAGSIHQDHIQNAFSPFALSIPHDLQIVFTNRN